VEKQNKNVFLILFSRVQLIFTAGRVMQTSGKAK